MPKRAFLSDTLVPLEALDGVQEPFGDLQLALHVLHCRAQGAQRRAAVPGDIMNNTITGGPQEEVHRRVDKCFKRLLIFGSLELQALAVLAVDQ
jgi:hypothetical protein